jgi:DNA adenine methylase
MNFNNLSKVELFLKCDELGIKKYKSKNKSQLIKILNDFENANVGKPTDKIILNDFENANSNDANVGKPTKNANVGEITEKIILNDFENANSNVVNVGKPTENEKVGTENVNVKNPTNKKLKPLIKWSGGKSDEIKLFEEYFPEHYDLYIEPFIGGGSVFFYLNPKNAVISDVHCELIDLYKSIGDGKGTDIYNFMIENANDEETYYRIRDEMQINSELDSAKRFYYQRKTCFRGMLRYNNSGKFNIPFGKYKNINFSELKNVEYENLLKRTKIFNEGFEHIFENYNDENNFVFLDPPYDSEFTDYGYCQFGREEQKKLASCFKNTKNKCLMIIGKTDFIEELYDGYIVAEYDKKYKFKLYKGRVGNEINTKHLVIKNY